MKLLRRHVSKFMSLPLHKRIDILLSLNLYASSDQCVKATFRDIFISLKENNKLDDFIKRIELE